MSGSGWSEVGAALLWRRPGNTGAVRRLSTVALLPMFTNVPTDR